MTMGKNEARSPTKASFCRCNTSRPTLTPLRILFQRTMLRNALFRQISQNSRDSQQPRGLHWFTAQREAALAQLHDFANSMEFSHPVEEILYLQTV